MTRYLTNFEMEIEDADLENGINTFAFDNWCPALVETRRSTLRTDCPEKVLYDLGLLTNKQLSGSSKTDFYSTKINLDSTRNALATLNTKVIHYNYANCVYAMSEHKNNKKKMDKPTKVVPSNLTPVTIMVVDTIFSVK